MSNETENTFPVTGLSATERKSIETLYRAFSDNNPDLLDEAVTSDWQDIPLAPGQGPGPAGLKPIIGAFIAAFPDMKITIKEIIGAPGRAGVRALITGTHKGEWFGIAPTNKTVSIPLHEFHHLENGRITHTWHLEDWFSMLQQVGAWPPAEGATIGDAL
ncbi:ester cyclase [Rhizobium jaguaris]|uniref:ester cyclase n=1 Tax=Rhizobium jaguaris TaxID=1312183 RepID=UPI0039BF48B3